MNPPSENKNLARHTYEMVMSSGQKIYFLGDSDAIYKLTEELNGFIEFNTMVMEKSYWVDESDPTEVNKSLIETIKIYRDERI